MCKVIFDLFKNWLEVKNLKFEGIQISSEHFFSPQTYSKRHIIFFDHLSPYWTSWRLKLVNFVLIHNLTLRRYRKNWKVLQVSKHWQFLVFSNFFKKIWKPQKIFLKKWENSNTQNEIFSYHKLLVQKQVKSFGKL